MTDAQIEFYKRLAHGLALQFGPNCEIVVHDLETSDLDRSVVAIENGHVSGRKLGDGPSHIVLEALQSDGPLEDRAPYLTKTADGKILKSSTIFIRNDAGKPVGVLAIGYLDRRGAFLISKSSEKACEFFGISKYSFYSYLNEAKAAAEQ